MNKDKLKGKAKDIAGRIERQVGEWTGDAKEQAEGLGRQAEGKVQKAWGELKDAGQRMKNDLRNRKRTEDVERGDVQPGTDIERDEEAA